MTGTALSRVSLTATLALTSHAEYAAGVAAGLPLWHPFGADQPAVGLPWLLPVAIDCYVVDALERRRGGDRWAALGILAASVIGGSAYTATTGSEAAKAAGVGVILVLVLSRLYSPVKERVTAKAQPVKPKAQATVKPQVAPVLTPVVTPARPRVAAATQPKTQTVAVIPKPGSKQDRLATVTGWVRDGKTWADMIRDDQAQYGVSEATAKRDVEDARTAARETADT